MDCMECYAQVSLVKHVEEYVDNICFNFKDENGYEDFETAERVLELCKEIPIIFSFYTYFNRLFYSRCFYNAYCYGTYSRRYNYRRQLWSLVFLSLYSSFVCYYKGMCHLHKIFNYGRCCSGLY